MSHDTTEPSLLVRVRNPADDTAWREFDAKYHDLILGYCRARGLQPSDAEDVRQLVMVNLARKLPTFDYQPAKGRFRYYLGRAVRNTIHSHISRGDPARAGIDSAVAAGLADDSVEQDAAWEKEWVNHHFRLAMETIRKTHEPASVAMFERLLAGETVDAIAASTGASEQSIYKVKQRIRDRMKELIDQQVRDEDEPRG